jgi:hypothetical protein
LSGKNRKVVKSVKGAKKKKGEGGTRTYATAMKRSSALNNFMIVAPLSYQAIFRKTLRLFFEQSTLVSTTVLVLETALAFNVNFHNTNACCSNTALTAVMY